MIGLLTDVNIAGQLPRLRAAFDAEKLTELLLGLPARFVTHRDLGLDPAMDDRSLWQYCQTHRLLLLTDNRNNDGPNSLQETLNDSLRADSLPVLTPGDKDCFHTEKGYQLRVALSIAEIMFGVAEESKYLGIGRLYVPLPEHI